MEKIKSIRRVSREEAKKNIINSIAERYKELRSLSKAPTFRTYLSGAIHHTNE
jgi:hypothetical protein